MNEIEAIANAGAEGAKAGRAGFDLIGKVFGPAITRRQATADAQAEVQGAMARRLAAHIESNPVDPDILETLMVCGGQLSFTNLAKIVKKAESRLIENAMPSLITDDWAANFRDKARNCSDEEMAELWAQLLAGEANNPGSYSRKSVNILSDTEPEDARLFKSLSNFRLIPVDPKYQNTPNGQILRWFERAAIPSKLAVLDDKHPIYTDNGINFRSLARMEWLGLVRYVSFGYVITQSSDKFAAYEHSGGHLYLASDEPIPFGYAEFTPAGEQLSELCIPLESPSGFIDYLTEVWRSRNVRVAHDISEVVST